MAQHSLPKGKQKGRLLASLLALLLMVGFLSLGGSAAAESPVEEPAATESVVDTTEEEAPSPTTSEAPAPETVTPAPSPEPEPAPTTTEAPATAQPEQASPSVPTAEPATAPAPSGTPAQDDVVDNSVQAEDSTEGATLSTEGNGGDLIVVIPDYPIVTGEPTCESPYITVTPVEQDGLWWNYGVTQLAPQESKMFIADWNPETHVVPPYNQTAFTITNEFDDSECEAVPVDPNAPQGTPQYEAFDHKGKCKFIPKSPTNVAPEDAKTQYLYGDKVVKVGSKYLAKADHSLQLQVKVKGKWVNVGPAVVISCDDTEPVVPTGAPDIVQDQCVVTLKQPTNTNLDLTAYQYVLNGVAITEFGGTHALNPGPNTVVLHVNVDGQWTILATETLTCVPVVVDPDPPVPALPGFTAEAVCHEDGASGITGIITNTADETGAAESYRVLLHKKDFGWYGEPVNVESVADGASVAYNLFDIPNGLYAVVLVDADGMILAAVELSVVCQDQPGPVDPDPTDPVDPVDPVNPDPTDPADSADPVIPVKPGDKVTVTVVDSKTTVVVVEGSDTTAAGGKYAGKDWVTGPDTSESVVASDVVTRSSSYSPVPGLAALVALLVAGGFMMVRRRGSSTL